MNLSAQFKAYLFSQKNPASRVTVKNYVSDVNRFIAWFESKFGSEFNPSDVSYELINNYKLECQDKYSASSIDRSISSLRKFFTFLKLESIISQSPFEASQIKVRENDIDPWKIRDFKNYLYVLNASPLTMKNYVIDVKQFKTWLESTIPADASWNSYEARNLVSSIDSRLINDYKTRLLNEVRLSPVSVNRKLSSLRRYTAWAKEEGIIKPDIRVINEPKLATPDALALAMTEAEYIPEQPETHKGYSKFPPLRAVQKSKAGAGILLDAAIIAPIALGLGKLDHALWIAKGKPVFDAATQSSTSSFTSILEPMRKPSGPVKNVPKSFYSPTSISVANFPAHKKAIHHARHTRPEWYRKYHSYAFVSYLHFSVLMIIISVLGYMIFNNLEASQKPKPSVLASLPSAPNRHLSFQGRLTDEQGAPINKNTSLRIGIYTSQTASGSALLWQEVINTTPDSDGIFNLMLGKGTAIPSTLFSQNSSLWLGVTVERTKELSPRQPIATVAYASNAETLQGLPPITTTTATANVVLALNSSGNLTIGGRANPTFQATGGTFTLAGNSVMVTTNTGSNGNIAFSPNGTGVVDIQKAIVNTTNNDSPVAGAVTVNDIFIVNSGSSTQGILGINQTSSGDLITASTSGSTRFRVDNGGNVTANGTINGLTISSGTITNGTWNGNAISPTYGGTGLNTSASTGVPIISSGAWSVQTILETNYGGTGISSYNIGDLIYSNASDNLDTLQIGSSGQCLVSNGTIPTWDTCGAIPADAVFSEVAGLIFPDNTDADFAIGGNSTNSAKFAVLNVNAARGSQIATISGGLTLDSGTANIQATNFQTLTVGGNQTGEIHLNPSNSDGIVRVNDYLDVNKAVSLGVQGILTTGGDPTYLLHAMEDYATTGNAYGIYSHRFLYNTANSDSITGVMGVSGAFNDSGTPTHAWARGVAGRIDNTGSGQTLTNGAALYAHAADNDATMTNSYGLFVADQNSTAANDYGIAIEGADTQALWIGSGANNTDAANGIAFGSSRDTNLYRSAADTLRTDDSFSVGGATLTLSNAAFTNCEVLSTVSNILSCGSLPPTSSNYWRLSSGAISPVNDTLDLLIGSNATTSAKFAVLNVNGSGPATASVSGNLIVMPNNGAGGRLGVGTTAPGASFEVAGAGSGNYLGSPSLAVIHTADSTPWGLVFRNDAAGVNRDTGIYLDNNGTFNIDTGSGSGSSTYGLSIAAITGNTGIGTNTQTSALHVTHPLNQTANGKALVIFDQIENQDIFTASSSGSPRLSLTNTGSLNVYSGGGDALQIYSRAGGTDHVYMEYFSDSDNPDTRSAFTGFPNTGSSVFTFNNTLGTEFSFTGATTFTLSGVTTLASSSLATFTTAATLGMTSTTTLNLGNNATLSSNATALNLEENGGVDINLGGGSGATGCTVTNSTGAFACTAGGTFAGVNAGSGLLQGTGGLTITGAANINTSGSSAINLGTGSSSSTITLGRTTLTDLALNDAQWSISGAGAASLASLNLNSGGLTNAGAISGATGITSSGTITFSGLTASRFVTSGSGGALGTSATLANLVSSVSDISGSTGTTNLVLSGSPTLTGTLTAAAANFTGAFNLNTSGSSAINLGTSTYTGTLTLGNASANVAITDANWSITGAGAGVLATLNTGQGAYELYAMNQNVQTSNSVTFAGITNNGILVNNDRGAFTRVSGQSSSADLRVTESNYWMDFNSRYGSGNFNPLVAADDHGIIFTNGSAGTGALTIAPWNATSTGLRITTTGTTIQGTANISGTLTAAAADFSSTVGIASTLTMGTGADIMDVDEIEFQGSENWIVSQYGSCGSSTRLCFENNGGTAAISFTPAGQGRAAAGFVTNTPDYAENINIDDQSIEAGDIVSIYNFDPNESDIYRKSIASKSNTKYDSYIIGAISENPGFLATQGNAMAVDDRGWGDHERPFVVAGRIGIKVTTANGDIKVGDRITSSNIPGIGMKATQPGRVIGIAMQDYSNSDTNHVEKILVFINPQFYDPDVELNDSGQLTLAPVVDNNFEIKRENGEKISRVGGFSELVVARIKAGYLELGRLTVTTADIALATIGELTVNTARIAIAEIGNLTTNSLAIATENVTIAGVGIRDYIYSIVDDRITQKQIAIAAPIIEADIIKPNSGKNLTVKLPDNDSRLIIQNSSSSAVATFDAEGNASLAGKLVSNSIQTNDATISGTLRASKIIADDIELSEDLLAKFEGITLASASSTINNNYITNNYFSSTPSSSLSPLLAASGISSESGTLGGINADYATFTNGLMAFGPSSFFEISVADRLFIGSQLSIADRNINVLGGDLELQPLRQGGIAFVGGEVKIDSDGNLKVNGNAVFAKNVEVSGRLAAGIIAPIPGKNLVFEFEEATENSKVEFKTGSGSAVLSVTNKGDVKASGSGTFNKINLSFIPKAIAVNDTEVIATGSAGTTEIKANQKELTIKNPLVTKDSLIYITPKTGTPNQSVYLLRQVPGESFTVGLSKAINKSVPFNWILIN